MHKINPVYLWYSTILLFPPVHEWGHVIITWMTGNKVIGMNWFSVVMNKTNIYQELWEYSPYITGICVLLYLHMFMKQNNVHLRDIRLSKISKIRIRSSVHAT